VGLTVQTLSLPGCQCERIGSEYSAPQRNAITFVGGTTFSNQGGILAIDRCVTTRYQDAYGSRDTRAYDAEDLWLVDYLLTDYQAWAQMMYPRMRLLNDVVGTSLPPDCTSPNGVHDDTVSWYRGHERLGHVQDTETFDKNLKVVIPAGDSKRLDIRLPAEIASNLKLFAVLMTFGN
jgi:phage tail sheath gpL-like